MYRQSLSILLAIGVAAGCDEGKRYPTAPAPKTLKVAPMKAAPIMAMDADDDDDTDDDDGAPMRRRDPSSAGMGTTFVGSGSGAGSAPDMAPGMDAPRPGAVASINGHPEGPKAEVFNAVVNNAFANALGCFAKATSDQTLAFRVKMTVGNGGTVDEATVVSGPPMKPVRDCLEGVVKRLTFPPFKGPPVTQTIPFAAVRQGGGAATP